MIDLRGKRVTIAGKLAGRYAGKGVKMLGIDLRRFLGATELLRVFDRSADVAILGAQPERHLEAIDEAGMATIHEAEVERAIAESEAKAAPHRD